MTRRERRRSRALARSGSHKAQPAHAATPPTGLPVILRRADRKALLLGTALASTLLLSTVVAPAPAHAVDCLAASVPPAGASGPITVSTNVPITCVNTVPRNAAGNVIDLFTNTAGAEIYLNNSGGLTSTAGRTIRAYSHGTNSRVDVINTGDLNTQRTAIYARTFGANSYLHVFNSGHITGVYAGIQANTSIVGNVGSSLSVINTGDIDLQRGTAISASTYGVGNELYVANSGALSGARGGIFARTTAANSRLTVNNSGDILTASDPVNHQYVSYGIQTTTYSTTSSVGITNSGDIRTTSQFLIIGNGYGLVGAFGIHAFGAGPPTITNSGAISVQAIDTTANSVGYTVRAFGIDAFGYGPASITNSGPISVQASANRYGAALAYGIRAYGYGLNNIPISVWNSGDITVTAGNINGRSTGIYAKTYGTNSPVNVLNSGKVTVSGRVSTGIYARTKGANSPITINNSGSVYAAGGPNAMSVGISVRNYNSTTTIINSGDIAASSQLAIAVHSGPVNIFNTGVITGFRAARRRR